MHPSVAALDDTRFASDDDVAEVAEIETPVRAPDALAELIGESAVMQRVRERIRRAAASQATVLVTGESGTGKELAVRALHRLSSRAAGPLVEVNCAAIPEALCESELFGYQRGAFTGAEQNRDGWLGAADGGTLFLDEVGEIPLALQAKLLRVVETRTFHAIGSRRARSVSMRFVCATNRDLAIEVRRGAFRADLFYRLNVVTVAMPPLRERREDIPALVQHFVTKLRLEGSELEGVSPAAIELLKTHVWPGNVRELENLIERLAVLKGEGVVTRQDVLAELDDAAPVLSLVSDASSSSPAATPGFGPLRDVVGRFEKDVIAEALRATGGNKNRAAQMLGINRTTLVEKLRRVGEAA